MSKFLTLEAYSGELAEDYPVLNGGETIIRTDDLVAHPGPYDPSHGLDDCYIDRFDVVARWWDI